MGNGSHIYFFWQEVGGNNFKKNQLNFSVVQALFTVYLLHELKIPEEEECVVYWYSI